MASLTDDNEAGGNLDKRNIWLIGVGHTRVCLKIHSRHLYAPLCGIFGPNSGYIAHYAPFIWPKSPTNCDAHLPESNFQTRSSFAATLYIGDYKSSCLRPMRSEMYCTIWSLGISRGISSSE